MTQTHTPVHACSDDDLFAIELGNEPDHWLKVDKCYRDLAWTYDDYKGEALAMAQGLRAAWPDNQQLSIMVWWEYLTL